MRRCDSFSCTPSATTNSRDTRLTSLPLSPSMQGHCRGGAVLSVLHEATLGATGEPHKHKLCRHLIEEVRLVACGRLSRSSPPVQCLTPHTPVPQTSALYFGILETWINEGVVKDPAAEFMVVEGTDGTGTAWCTLAPPTLCTCRLPLISTVTRSPDPGERGAQLFPRRRTRAHLSLVGTT